MSDRSTSEWTETLKEVFGETGKQGEIGEIQALELLHSLEIEYRYNPADKTKQCNGLDIEIKLNGDDSWYGIDVKANIHSDGNKKVCIDYPKLKESKALYWLHINSEDHMDDFIIYPVKSMIELARAVSPKKGGLRWVWKDEARSLK